MKCVVAYRTDQITVGPGLQKRSVPFQVQDWRLSGREWVDLEDI